MEVISLVNYYQSVIPEIHQIKEKGALAECVRWLMFNFSIYFAAVVPDDGGVRWRLLSSLLHVLYPINPGRACMERVTREKEGNPL